MKKKSLWVITFIFTVIAITLVINHFMKEKEKVRAAEIQYLDHAPEVQLSGHAIEVYSFNRCTYKDENCHQTTKEEVLKGKPSVAFEEGADLVIKTPIPPWGIQADDTPLNEIKGGISGSYTKDGQNLGPTDIQSTLKLTKKDNIETIKLPKGPGNYVIELSVSSPSGKNYYVFQFAIK